MLSHTRKNKILELLEKNEQISTQELEKKLNVSGATIRNDLSELESKGFIKRIHGGAILSKNKDYNKFRSFHKRSEKNIEEKKAIGQKSKNLVEDDQTIMLDASSTILYFLPHLLKFNKMTIITNGIYTAMEVRNNDDFNVILLGGIIRSKSGAVEGLLGAEMLNNISADIMFTSSHGFTIEDGLTDFNFYEVELKKKMVSRSKKLIALVDHTKIGHTSASSFAKSENIDLLITDSGIKKDQIKKIKDAGIELMIGDFKN